MRTRMTVLDYRNTVRHNELRRARRRHGDSTAPSYCMWCGSTFVFEVRTTGTFDEYTGDQEAVAWLVCPNRTRFFPWSTHPRYRLKPLAIEGQRALLADAVIEQVATG